MRLPSDQEDQEQPQRPVTRTRSQAQSLTPKDSIDDALCSSESDYEDVDPPRPLTVQWRDILPQSLLVARSQRQVTSEVQDPPVARNLPGVDLHLETCNIPDDARSPTIDPDTERDEEGGAMVRGDGGVDEDEPRVERSRRVKKSVVRLSYDGQTILSASDSHEPWCASWMWHLLGPQVTAWCHPMAMCPHCFSLSPSTW